MLLRLLFLLILFQTFPQLYLEASYWDAKLVSSYVHYSELQRRWAMSFLAPHLKNLKGDEEILDVGCGDGKITADISKFIPDGSIVGIDSSEAMLKWAYRQYPTCDYPNLSFKEGSFLALPSLTFDVIISLCALQHCSKQTEAILSLKHALKPNGKLLILVPCMKNSAWNSAAKIVMRHPKWEEYWKNFSPCTFLNEENYIEILTKLNMHIVDVKHIQTMDPFVNREEILDWMEGTFPPVVPKHLAREFFTHWIDEYLKQDPSALSHDGIIYTKLGYLTLEATLK